MLSLKLFKIFSPFCRQDDPKVKELFDAIEQIKREFESIERPTLEIETPSPKEEMSSEESSYKESEESSKGSEESLQKGSLVAETIEAAPSKKEESSKSASDRVDQSLDPEAELAKLESEFGNMSRDYTAEEIGGWEFDELEQELKSGHSVSK